MDIFHNIVRRHFYISLLFFVLGLLFGFIYSLSLLGYTIDTPLLNPANVRSIHISLMLYGFIPLMLSYLPFFLLYKDLGVEKNALRYLELYTIVWYLFLVIMIMTLAFGLRRGLPFYDFDYRLNFLLAFAGFFYLMALYQYIRLYEVKPLWVKISFTIVVVAPFLLLFLMNPIYGKVEQTLSGPHGDNTLGMSFALLPVYYLVIKYLNRGSFLPRWHIFWIIPLLFYIGSVLYRAFVGVLSYEAEWFLQWLTLLYIPLLLRWLRDSDIDRVAKRFLIISIIAFFFVDIEGNILFIPEFRWIFHRNDLVIAHAHVAMGIAVLFVTLSLYVSIIKALFRSLFVFQYLFGMVIIVLALTFAGFVEAYNYDFDVRFFWILRSVGGIFIIISFFYLTIFHIKADRWTLYNFIGVISDFVAALVLFFAGEAIYTLLGFSFEDGYLYVVFVFMTATGLMHLLALLKESFSCMLVSAIVRLGVGSIFLTLYLVQRLDESALLIAGYDIGFALIYFLFIYGRSRAHA